MTLETFNRLKLKSIQLRAENAKERIFRLKGIQNWIQNNEKVIEDALLKDFNKPAFETQISEILLVQSELKHTIAHLSGWMKDKSVKTPLSLMGHKSFIRYEPKGVVLVISPWNYPFQLSILPIITALSAGNAVILKPSELTPETNQALKKFILDCGLTDVVYMEEGGKEVTTDLLKLPLNHVFFTGSTEVGRIVAQACAPQLIPYTLELGGKSPVIVDESADIKDTVEKVFWGKFLNRGQTCVAPDLIFVHESVKDLFLEEYAKKARECSHESVSNMISERHAERLTEISNKEINLGSEKTKIIPIDQFNEKNFKRLMLEEIFGPVSPLITFKVIEDIEHYISDDPLALYVFSRNDHFIDHVLNRHLSGSVGINSIAVQLANPDLPFGGIGRSGQGRYHGHFGFLEFSHQRSVMRQKRFFFLTKSLFPPYTAKKWKMLRILKKMIT